MILTNREIYNISENFNQAFGNYDQYLPAKLNFYMIRNNKKIFEAAQDIEMARNNILNNYAEEREDGLYIPPDKVDKANEELSDLLSIKIDLDIKTIKLEDIPTEISFNLAQMNALMFMIEE